MIDRLSELVFPFRMCDRQCGEYVIARDHFPFRDNPSGSVLGRSRVFGGSNLGSCTYGRLSTQDVVQLSISLPRPCIVT